MLGHVSIRVRDLEASVQFYLAALAPLKYQEMRFPTVVGLGPQSSHAPIPDLWLRQRTLAAKGPSADGAMPVHISFYAKNRKAVDDFYAAGLGAGGQDNGGPGFRRWMPGYYGTYCPFLGGASAILMLIGSSCLYPRLGREQCGSGILCEQGGGNRALGTCESLASLYV